MVRYDYKSKSKSGGGIDKNTMLIFIILTVLIPLVGIILGIVYMQNQDTKEQGKLLLFLGIGICVLVYLLAMGGMFTSLTLGI